MRPGATSAPEPEQLPALGTPDAAPGPARPASTSSEPEQQAADLRGFRASLWGLPLPSHHELIADLRKRFDERSRLKVDREPTARQAMRLIISGGAGRSINCGSGWPMTSQAPKRRWRG